MKGTPRNMPVALCFSIPALADAPKPVKVTAAEASGPNRAPQLRIEMAKGGQLPPLE
jgi:hypothetical protein